MYGSQCNPTRPCLTPPALLGFQLQSNRMDMNNSELSSSEVLLLLLLPLLLLLLRLFLRLHLKAITESSASTEGTEMKCPCLSPELHVFDQSQRLQEDMSTSTIKWECRDVDLEEKAQFWYPEVSKLRIFSFLISSTSVNWEILTVHSSCVVVNCNHLHSPSCFKHGETVNCKQNMQKTW